MTGIPSIIVIGVIFVILIALLIKWINVRKANSSSSYPLNKEDRAYLLTNGFKMRHNSKGVEYRQDKIALKVLDNRIEVTDTSIEGQYVINAKLTLTQSVLYTFIVTAKDSEIIYTYKYDTQYFSVSDQECADPTIRTRFENFKDQTSFLINHSFTTERVLEIKRNYDYMRENENNVEIIPLENSQYQIARLVDYNQEYYKLGELYFDTVIGMHSTVAKWGSYGEITTEYSVSESGDSIYYGIVSKSLDVVVPNSQVPNAFDKLVLINQELKMKIAQNQEELKQALDKFKEDAIRF